MEVPKKIFSLFFVLHICSVALLSYSALHIPTAFGMTRNEAVEICKSRLLSSADSASLPDNISDINAKAERDLANCMSEFSWEIAKSEAREERQKEEWEIAKSEVREERQKEEGASFLSIAFGLILLAVVINLIKSVFGGNSSSGSNLPQQTSHLHSSTTAKSVAPSQKSAERAVSSGNIAALVPSGLSFEDFLIHHVCLVGLYDCPNARFAFCFDKKEALTFFYRFDSGTMLGASSRKVTSKTNAAEFISNVQKTATSCKLRVEEKNHTKCIHTNSSQMQAICELVKQVTTKGAPYAFEVRFVKTKAAAVNFYTFKEKENQLPAAFHFSAVRFGTAEQKIREFLNSLAS